MPAANITKNTFEGIEQITKGGVKQVKKVVETMTTDVKDSFLGEAKPLSPEEKQQLVAQDEQERQKYLSTVRQNIQKIDEEILRIKKQREQKLSEQNRQQAQIKQRQQVEKKQEESVLAKLIRSKKGTREGIQRASG